MRKILLVLVILPLVVHADIVEIDGIWYDVISKGEIAKVIKSQGEKYSGAIVIPETINHDGISCKVTEIGNQAFFNCRDVTSISLPKTIVSVDLNAFGGCYGLNAVYITDLTAWCKIKFGYRDSNPLSEANHLFLNGQEVKGELVIPDGVETIGNYAFQNCTELTSVVIDNSVTSIGENAFNGCGKLASVTIPSSVVVIGRSAFDGCTSLNSVFITNLTAWCNIKFDNNPLKYAGHLFLNSEEVINLVIPEGITTIGYAFPNCKSLTSVIFPNTMTEIGASSFEDCTGLTSVSIPDNVTVLGASAFSGCSNLQSVDLGAGLKYIRGSAFMDCEKLASVVFPIGLVEIGANSFRNCVSLSSVVIPNSVTTLDYYAFYGCKGLTSIVLGRGLKSGTIGNTTSVYFGDYVFAGCEKLEHVYCFIESNIPNMANIFANSYPQYATLHVVYPMLEDYKSANPWSEFGTTICLTPEELKLNKDKCKKVIDIADVNIKNKLISYYDYDGDGELNEGEAEYVNNDAFEKCVFKGNKEITSFDELKYFTSITKIEPEKFYDCSGLFSVCIGEGVTIIGYNAFMGCTALASVTIPSSLNTVGDDAFMYCVELTSVKNYATIPPAIYEYSFYNSKNAILYVPKGCKPVYEATTYWKEFKEIIEMDGEGETNPSISFADSQVKRICIENWDADGDGELSMDEAKAVTDLKNVFKNNTIITNFDELKYFTGLKVINYGDFGGCSNLESIILPASLEEIGEAPFDNCSALKSIVIPASVKKIGKANIGTYLWNLESIQVEEGNTVYDSRDNCNAIIETASNKLIAGCQSTVIPDDVTTIAASAFNTCLEKPIVIPEGVTNIEKNAFMGNHFKTIVLPSTLTSMTWAFQGCSIKLVESHITNPFALDELTFDMAAKAVLYVPKGTKEKYEAMEGWKKFSAIIEIEEETADNIINFEDETVKQLCLTNWDVNASGELSFNEAAGILNLERVFYTSNISKFQELKYFTRLKSISEYAFRESGLASVVLPPSVGSIDHGAFLGCKMTEIDIPASVTSIGENAFLRCNSLASVKVNWQEPIAIDEKAFPTRTNIVLSVPIGTKAAYQDASYWKDFKEILSIYDGASGTYSIGDENAATLTDGSNMVQKETVIPSSITIDGEEFAVTAIGENAFVNNTEMTQLTIPESISEIGQGAFAGCSALEVIYNYRKEPIPLGNVVAAARTRSADGSDVFAGVNKETCVLYVPAGSKSKYAAADGWKEFQTIKEFGVVATKPGDANSDEKINVADIVEIVNFMKKTPSEHFNEANADVNADGDVDDEDIKAIEDYLLNVEPKTLKELKAQVNLGGDFSGHLGWNVDGEGNISSSDADAVGRICYISTSDVDIAFVGSRILVLANEDITNQHGITWGVYGEPTHLTATKEPEGLCGYNNTNTLQAFGHERKVRDVSGSKVEYESGYPAACYAWNYSGAKPVGASHWFLPSFIQCKKMLTAARKSGTGQLSSGKVYWSSTDNSGNFASFYTLSQTGDNPKDYTLNLDPDYEESWKETWEEWSKFCVRACYAY